jgi:hypothetical protein
MAGAERPPLPGVEACEGHRPSPDEGSDPPLRLAAGRRRGCLAIPLTDPRSRELAGDNDWAAVDDAAVPRR